MINGNTITAILTAISKASRYATITVRLSTETLTITSDALSVTMPVTDNGKTETFSVDCLQLTQVIKGISTITMDFYDDRSNLLIGDTSQTVGTIPIGKDVTSFPEIIDGYQYLNIASKFLRSWGLACSSIAIPGVRYQVDDGLCTVLVEHDSRVIKLVSTDGHRLSVGTGFSEIIAEAYETKAVYIPQKTSLAVHQLLKREKGNVLTGVNIQTIGGVDYLQMEAGEITITVRSIQVSRFPKYRDVFPKANPLATISMNKGILQAIKRLWENRSVLTHEKRGKLRKQDMRLTFSLSKSGSFIRITNRWDVDQEVSPTLNASQYLQFEAGDNAYFVLDYTYLMDAMEALKGEDLTLSYWDRLKPVTFQDAQGNLALIMPMDER